MNQNPPVSPYKKHTILRVLDFCDTGRGVEASELQRRAGIDRSEYERGICQLENDGLVRSVKVSKSGTATSVWSTSPGFRLTEAGHMALAMEPTNPCRALMVRPCVALMVVRAPRITEVTPDRLSDSPLTLPPSLTALRFQPAPF